VSASTPTLEDRFVERIAREVGCRPAQVRAADGLFAEGTTVPFVARYRKEVTGGLGDAELETLAKRREYFLELADRRDAILESIDAQGRLSDELEAKIRAAVTKQELEDLYLPYKPKRRTRAQKARERGLEPLADALLEAAASPTRPEELARPFVQTEVADEARRVADEEAALAGARDVLAERLAEDADHRARLRRRLEREGVFSVRAVPGKEEEGAVYRDWFEHDEPLRDMPSHRLLAMLRGEREGVLSTDVGIDDEDAVAELERSWGVPMDTPCGRQIAEATADSYKRLLRPSLTHQVRSDAVDRAEAEAIAVFRENLEALLMQAPLGQVPVMGIDPGLRTGSKVAVVDATGRVVATTVLHPLPPNADPDGAAATVSGLVKKHRVHAVAVGNGTASRETEAFVRRALQHAGPESVIVAIVPETGASVYSASATAREELPELDVSLRGAVSIARRLQDPLAELVKIEPKSLGVGQYQHDVDQKALARELDLAVEGVVNRVGVELNTASPALLRRVSGLSERLARAIVETRDRQGAFTSRQSLLQIGGLGAKTFELAAGFLRLRDGEHPLDRTAVHPERYPVVERMAGDLGTPLSELVGSPELVARIDFSRFRDAEENLGEYTLDDIREELLRPGRDPRPDFRAPEWREDVTSLDDLQSGMVLEGRVSNVTNFGAFVDVGVKRDGLVHVSELSHEWVEDPREVVQVGQIVRVQVIDVDRERQRIGLSIKQLQRPPSRPRGPRGGQADQRGGQGEKSQPGIEDLMAKFNRR